MEHKEPMIMPVRPGTLDAYDKRELRKIGVVVIEHENPEELRLLKPMAEVSGGAMLVAAVRALTQPGGNYVTSAQTQFAREVAAAVLKQHAG